MNPDDEIPEWVTMPTEISELQWAAREGRHIPEPCWCQSVYMHSETKELVYGPVRFDHVENTLDNIEEV